MEGAFPLSKAAVSDIPPLPGPQGWPTPIPHWGLLPQSQHQVALGEKGRNRGSPFLGFPMLTFWSTAEFSLFHKCLLPHPKSIQ